MARDADLTIDLTKASFGVDVAVSRDGDAAQLLGRIADAFADDEVIGDDERAESWRQDDRAVVGIGRWQLRLCGWGAEQRTDCDADKARLRGEGIDDRNTNTRCGILQEPPLGDPAPQCAPNRSRRLIR